MFTVLLGQKTKSKRWMYGSLKITYHATKEELERYRQIRMIKRDTVGFTTESKNACHPEFQEAIQERHTCFLASKRGEQSQRAKGGN